MDAALRDLVCTGGRRVHHVAGTRRPHPGTARRPRLNRRVLRFASVTSTQEAAAELPVGYVVVADEQTSGRGRLGRRWETPPGSGLAATFVVPPVSLLSLRAGVAAAEACGESVRLKWPNDLVVDDRKLGGILVEMKAAKALVGIGVNVAWAPPGAARLDVDREVLLDRLAGSMDEWLEQPEAAVTERWSALSATLKRRVRVSFGDRVIEGIAERIDGDGNLVVDGQRIAFGDVMHLRPL